MNMDPENFFNSETFLSEDENSTDVEDDQVHSSLLNDIVKISSRNRSRATRNVRASSSLVSTVKDLQLINKVTVQDIKEKSKNVKPLEKPLEKPVANRIKRAAGYEQLSMEVNKWEKLVNNRRNYSQLTFPLQKTDVRIQTSEKIAIRDPKTEVQQKVYGLLHGAKLIKKVKETEEERNIKKAMSLQEIKEHNRELWRARNMRLRMERKAARQNASKSKRYHKILRKERMKKQKAEIELLSQTDPAAALEKLKEMEEIRMQERMSLRHRKSKWAHLQGLRAGHDKSVLTALEENKRLYEELTRKNKLKELENDEEKTEQYTAEGDMYESDSETPWSSNFNSNKSEENKEISYNKLKEIWAQVQEKDSDDEDEENNNAKKPKEKKSKNEKLCNMVEMEKEEDSEVDELFNDAEEQIKKTIKRKLDKIVIDDDKKGKRDIENKSKKFKQEKQKKFNPNQKEHDFTCVDTTEYLDETLADPNDEDMTLKKVSQKHLLMKESKSNASEKTSDKNESTQSPKKDIEQKKKTNLIDPKALMTLKSKKISNAKTNKSNAESEALDDNDSDSDSEEDPEDYIQDALADDYLIKDFKADKREAIDKDKPEIPTLALPGWGDWGGPGIQMSKRKMKKFRIQKPKQVRKDDNIGNVIYNEEADVHQNLRKAMVSDLPHEYTSVKDFEASIRAPIGRLFVPENVHRKLITPPVVTKKGTVIEPMTEDMLLKKLKKSSDEVESKPPNKKNKKRKRNK